MIMFAQSHRASKEDLYIVKMKEDVQTKVKNMKLEATNNQIYSDFNYIRSVQYKYSRKAQDTFFHMPIENYFFMKFAESKEGMKFLSSKPDVQKDKTKYDRMVSEMDNMKNEAKGILKKIAQQEDPNKVMINFFLQDLRK